ncbi:MAG: DUF2130 domain-containing protein [Bacilli bacterium]
MSIVKVIIKDQDTLELAEDAKKGDIIDLKEIIEVDTSNISKRIDESKDEIYKAKLEERKNELKRISDAEKETLVSSYETKLAEARNKDSEDFAKIKEELTANISSLKAELEKTKSKAKEEYMANENEIKKSYDIEINNLKNDINNLKSNKQNEIDDVLLKKELELKEEFNKTKQTLMNEKASLQAELVKTKSEVEAKYTVQVNEITNKHNLEINDLKNNINNLKSNMENAISVALTKKELDLKKEFDNEKEQLQKELNAKSETKIAEIEKEKNTRQEKFDNLYRLKSAQNVKNIGEDLEVWCDNTINEYMQNGLFNCVWKKDNDVVKNEDEYKGSKADFILDIFADETHDNESFLTSICLEMKDENPSSVNKKKNSDYYAALDKNRNKKKRKYALLVTNLESESTDCPIKKVIGYEDMYQVRPVYMMTFINMVVSLYSKFSSLVLNKNKEELELKESKDIIEEFEKLKKTYLDNPLDNLNKLVNEIITQNEKIVSASDSIKKSCDDIIKKYIEEIKNKLDRFNLNKIVKKVDNINE